MIRIQNALRLFAYLLLFGGTFWSVLIVAYLGTAAKTEQYRQGRVEVRQYLEEHEFSRAQVEPVLDIIRRRIPPCTMLEAIFPAAVTFVGGFLLGEIGRRK